MMTDNRSPYEVACEFIRLHDIWQTMHTAGITPSDSMRKEMGEYRDQLDIVLAPHYIPTRAEWNERVRRRLTAATERGSN